MVCACDVDVRFCGRCPPFSLRSIRKQHFRSAWFRLATVAPSHSGASGRFARHHRGWFRLLSSAWLRWHPGIPGWRVRKGTGELWNGMAKRPGRRLPRDGPRLSARSVPAWFPSSLLPQEPTCFTNLRRIRSPGAGTAAGWDHRPGGTRSGRHRLTGKPALPPALRRRDPC